MSVKENDQGPFFKLHEKGLRAAERAVYEFSVKQAREKLTDLTFPLEKIAATLIEVRECTEDRTSVIILFALFDDLIIELMTRNINPQIRGGRKKLFDGTGILSTSSSRITMCSALNWLSESTVTDIDLMRKIRNEFAHSVSVKKLSQQPVCDHFSGMTVSESRFLGVANAVAADNSLYIVRPLETYTLRDKLLIRGVDIVIRVCEELSTFELAKIHHVHYRDLLAREHKDDNLHAKLVKSLITVAGPVMFENVDKD